MGIGDYRQGEHDIFFPNPPDDDEEGGESPQAEARPRGLVADTPLARAVEGLLAAAEREERASLERSHPPSAGRSAEPGRSMPPSVDPFAAILPENAEPKLDTTMRGDPEGGEKARMIEIRIEQKYPGMDVICATCGKTYGAHFELWCDEWGKGRKFVAAEPASPPATAGEPRYDRDEVKRLEQEIELAGDNRFVGWKLSSDTKPSSVPAGTAREFRVKEKFSFWDDERAESYAAQKVREQPNHLTAAVIRKIAEFERVVAELRQERDALSEVMPEGFYADRTITFRVERLIAQWRNLLKANAKLEEKLTQKAGHSPTCSKQHMLAIGETCSVCGGLREQLDGADNANAEMVGEIELLKAKLDGEREARERAESALRDAREALKAAVREAVRECANECAILHEIHHPASGRVPECAAALRRKYEVGE